MGGCGFWFLLYFVVASVLACSLGVKSIWGIVGISLLVLLGVGLLRALLMIAFEGESGCGILFRLGVFGIFLYLLITGSVGWAIVLLVIYGILELVVAFS